MQPCAKHGKLTSSKPKCASFVLKWSTVWKMVGFSRKKSQKGFVNASGLQAATWHSRHSWSARCQFTWPISLSVKPAMQLEQARFSLTLRPSMSASKKLRDMEGAAAVAGTSSCFCCCGSTLSWDTGVGGEGLGRWLRVGVNDGE